jgi:hypothetical protein
VAFYGAGEVAEIAFVCLQQTPLELVGIVDHRPRPPFFGRPVRSVEDLSGDRLGDRQFARLLIVRADDDDAIQAALDARGVPDRLVSWL